MKLLKRYKKLLLVLLLLLVCVTALSEWLVFSSAEGRMFDRATIDQLPDFDTAIVLGCRPGSWYYCERIEAAGELYNAGKVKYILVSGDNSRVTYNETMHMSEDLQELGVPAERIYRDYAGFRTLDSMVRASEIFGRDQLIVVSQPFHIRRAIYLADNNGMDVVGYCADRPSYGWIGNTKMFVRERLARVKAVLDVVTGTRPHFLGKKIEIGKVVQQSVEEPEFSGGK